MPKWIIEYSILVPIMFFYSFIKCQVGVNIYYLPGKIKEILEQSALL